MIPPITVTLNWKTDYSAFVLIKMMNNDKMIGKEAWHKLEEDYLQQTIMTRNQN